MTNKFLTLLADGATHLVAAISSSGGIVDKEKIVATNAEGTIDITLLPTGLDTSAENMLAAESISAGDFINIFEDQGTRKVRLADAANLRPAHGFVLTNLALGDSGSIYTAGVNSQLTNLVPGRKYFLNIVPGAIIPLINLVSGNLVQSLGTAISSTQLRFEFDEPIYVD